MKKRAASEDEKSLFRRTVEHSNPRAVAAGKAKKPARKTRATGIDGHTQQRLKRGAQAPDMRLDLHGFTQDGAHRALKNFFQRAHKKGARLALVITGNGLILKEMVPRWLNQPDFAAFISGSAPAHIRHGGAGALYVYLRK
jgi:DNA-nicking Smr family endonuclease